MQLKTISYDPKKTIKNLRNYKLLKIVSLTKMSYTYFSKIMNVYMLVKPVHIRQKNLNLFNLIKVIQSI